MMASSTAPQRLGKRPRCADPTAADSDLVCKRRATAVEELTSSCSPATPASFASSSPLLSARGAAAVPAYRCVPAQPSAVGGQDQDRRATAPAAAANAFDDAESDERDVPAWLAAVGRRPAASDVRFLHALTSVIEDSCEVGPSVNDDADTDDDEVGDVADDASTISDASTTAAAADATEEATDALVATFDATDEELARFPTADDYVAHLATAGGVSIAALLMAWVYMGRARGHHPTASVVSEMTSRRLLAAAVRVAAKVLDEPVPKPAVWARVAGVDGGAPSVARCEVALLNLVHWGVHVGASGYAEMADLVCQGVAGMPATAEAA